MLFLLLKVMQKDGQEEIEQDKVHEYEDHWVEEDRDKAFCTISHGHEVVPIVPYGYCEDHCDAHPEIIEVGSRC